MRQRSSFLAVPARWLICLIFPLLVSGVPAAGVLGALPQVSVLAASAPSALTSSAPSSATAAGTDDHKAGTRTTLAAGPYDTITAGPYATIASGPDDHVAAPPQPHDHGPTSHDLSGRPHHEAVIGAKRGAMGAGQTALLVDRRRPATTSRVTTAVLPPDGGADPLAAPGVSPGRAPPTTG
ncbi:hypothetical protein IMZ11_09645 [Microtetraspora sp. AC03309]|uniref:hypothetical protein n=1 Tax=Microtetraspora sp. AC03309 TaxID=2779376 RepID=UPI001E65A5F1|nr:hypothetical protein [Microtetraspora sp. AC03309]MCC5575901.1 hypothetical protein [Microtetraspora sp. AC03309]